MLEKASCINKIASILGEKKNASNYTLMCVELRSGIAFNPFRQ